MITPRDEAQIAFYFREGYRFERSTAGPMLERAENLGVDSEGERVPPSSDNWHWLGDDSDPLQFVALDQQIQVHEMRLAGGYTPDERALIEAATASRRMLAVERVSPRAKMALEAYYGDRGAGWALRSQRNVGPGAIAALYILTVEGRALIDKERIRIEKAGGGAHRTDDQVLEVVLAVHRAQPDATRRARLMRVQDAAEALLREAWGVWTKTAPEKRRRVAA